MKLDNLPKANELAAQMEFLQNKLDVIDSLVSYDNFIVNILYEDDDITLITYIANEELIRLLRRQIQTQLAELRLNFESL